MKKLKFVDVAVFVPFFVISALYLDGGSPGTFVEILVFVWWSSIGVLYGTPLRQLFPNDSKVVNEEGNPSLLTWKQKSVIIIAGLISPYITGIIAIAYWFIYKKSFSKARAANLIAMGMLILILSISYVAGVMKANGLF